MSDRGFSRGGLRQFLPAALAVMLWGIAGPVAAAEQPASREDPRDVAAVQKFLAEKFPGEQWSRGPARISSAAVEAAYPKCRFYYVFSPQYPVGRAGFISALVRLDQAGKASLVSAPKDFGAGLARIADAEQAKKAGAAVMSLTFGPFGPVPVTADEVEVTAAGRAWLCTAAKGRGPGAGRAATTFRVRIDGEGSVTEATHRYHGPLPICIGGLFEPVGVPRPA